MNTNRRRSVLYLVAATVLVIDTKMSSAASEVRMVESEFWNLVERVKTDAGMNLDARPVALQKHLEVLSLQEIQEFQRRYESYLIAANQWELWAAAYIMNGGSSDDGFKYFRDWLISEGQATFSRAMSDPESLVEVPRRGEYFELEAFGYAALHAYSRKGGGELDRDFQVELAMPTGNRWNEGDLPRLLPKLAKRFLQR